MKSLWKYGLLVVALLLVTGVGQNPSSVEGRSASAEFVPSFDGVPIAFEVRGTGTPTLVFVHGWSCDRSYWDAQVETFTRRFEVVTVDLAGHGESGLGREIWTMSAFGLDIAAVLEEVGSERVILIGHSMGGDAIVEAARRMPDRVVGLVWVDTYKALGNPRSLDQVQEMLAPLRADFVPGVRDFVRDMFPEDADGSLVERIAVDMSSAPAEVALETLRSALTFDREMPVALQELDAPVVAINPHEPPTDIESLKKYGVEVVLMPGVGHFLMMEDPEGFNERLAEVFTGLRRATSGSLTPSHGSGYP